MQVMHVSPPCPSCSMAAWLPCAHMPFGLWCAASYAGGICNAWSLRWSARLFAAILQDRVHVQAWLVFEFPHCYIQRQTKLLRL